MALKRLKVRLAAPAPQETGDEIPVVSVEGTVIKEYNYADDVMKQADGVMKELRPEVEELAKTEIFTRCCKRPLTPTTSVKLQDESGEVICVSFVNKYKDVPDVELAEQLFDDNGIDINEYVTEGVKASFDDSVFYDQNGNFVQEIYDDIRKAIQNVVTKRQLPKNPLNTAKVIKPKPSFHVERFSIFPKVETQMLAFQILPNSLMLKPVRPKQKAEKAAK